MRKLVFKGIINGKEFDNVKDYNEAMTKLITEGATSIQASSETKIADEPKSSDDIRLVKEVDTKKEFNVDDYCPYFRDIDEYYLDYLVSPDKDLNKKNLSILEDSLKKAFAELHNVLGTGEVSFEDAFDLINDLKEIRSSINNDSNDNNDAIVQLTESIKRDTEKLEMLKYAKPVLGIISDYYDSAFNLVKDYLLKY